MRPAGGGIGGLVLAGGLSSRMGRDKALLELGGEPLVARAVRRLGEVCDEVAICGPAARLAGFGRVIPDGLTGCGPLGGIVAGLQGSNREWNCVLAVDVPFVPREAWERLLAEAEGCVAVLPVVGGFTQPLCGVYARGAGEALRVELEAGRWRVLDALRAAGKIREVLFEEESWFRNLNTPEEFAAAERAGCG